MVFLRRRSSQQQHQIMQGGGGGEKGPLNRVRCILKLVFVILNNIYCIPTYLVWNWVFFLPLRLLQLPLYHKLEGVLFKWLLCMVSAWSWGSKYYIYEVGDEVSDLYEEPCLVLVNHQSTGDVPMLMQAFQNKSQVTRHMIWILDRLFRYTNFGLVSATHGDYFITQGKNTRENQLQELQRHLTHSYLRRGQQWIVLFPEGGFLFKRKETSQKYARENNYPVLERLSLPRAGALHAVLDTLRPERLRDSAQPIKWIIDITVAYPDQSDPLTLFEITLGSRPPCSTFLHYRRFPVEGVPQDPEALKLWLYDRWSEKEQLLNSFYKDGEFEDNTIESLSPRQVTLQNWWIVVLHVIFISSTAFHAILAWKLGVFIFGSH
ncbi:LPGAT1 [Cordylochernes scorpioides]|uniref:LPGAT1 n=1 Tax=Cordylochernes scorpioides TaxID=51811 RepID=A0ABY6LTY2_9ARAC|nr:LPGAT1 [Cordylochernes scorpioides]